MKKLLLLIAGLAAAFCSAAQELPARFVVKTASKDHVQGIAIDTAANCFYLSFTTSLVKTDYLGNVIACIDTINGHLGAMTFDAASRKLYASLECKDDAIGQGIAKNLGKEVYSREQSRFYIAGFDVDSMTQCGLWEVSAAVHDYKNKYGCSGIDGVAIAPRIGKKPGAPCLYVAYGIYRDLDRTDNDHQILLEYKLDRLSGSTEALMEDAKYFIYTGNTSWGVQNMCYDPLNKCIFMACYAGKKPNFPNYTLFAVPVKQKPVKSTLKGLQDDGKHLSLALWKQGLLSKVEGIRGWRWRDGATGMCTIGEGVWFVSTPKKLKNKTQTATVRRLKWKGGATENPFEEAGLD